MSDKIYFIFFYLIPPIIVSYFLSLFISEKYFVVAFITLTLLLGDLNTRVVMRYLFPEQQLRPNLRNFLDKYYGFSTYTIPYEILDYMVKSIKQDASSELYSRKLSKIQYCSLLDAYSLAYAGLFFDLFFIEKIQDRDVLDAFIVEEFNMNFAVSLVRNTPWWQIENRYYPQNFVRNTLSGKELEQIIFLEKKVIENQTREKELSSTFLENARLCQEMDLGPEAKYYYIKAAALGNKDAKQKLKLLELK